LPTFIFLLLSKAKRKKMLRILIVCGDNVWFGRQVHKNCTL
jgi:hypothetical protein